MQTIASFLSRIGRVLGRAPAQGAEPVDDPTEEMRVVLINQTQTGKFANNEISTSKYNVITFLPRFLYEQFRRYANIFFLAIALLQQIPDVSPTGRYNTLVPLVFILTVSALKEIFEDVKRHKQDHQVNRDKTRVLRGNEWVNVRWMDVKVGDFTKIENNEPFHSDILLLSSSEPHGMAYIETSNLDGETNLKIRQAHMSTSDLLTHEQLSALHGAVQSESPNRHLYEFHGSISMEGKQTVGLGADQLLLRGSRLKNTKWAFGLVLYCGHETKLMMNSRKAPLKQSNVDSATNRQILCLFGLLLLVTLISGIFAQVWDNNNLGLAWYLPPDGGSSNFGYKLITFLILYNNLVPISLQVTLEVVRFFQAWFINNDIDMYHEETDAFAMARTSNLNEELGQVKYLLTDKTGTLTRNVMVFKKCSVGGQVYGSNDAERFDDAALLRNMTKSGHKHSDLIRDFLTVMGVCHTVVPDTGEDGQLDYQASSPDEAALVRGARDQQFVFKTRKPDSVVIDVMGEDETYQILNVLEFSSDRKRMSVIVRAPDGRLKVFIKGADNMILDRCGKHSHYKSETLRNLDDFANSGYRTLCLAQTEITEEFYTEWSRGYHEASIAISDRENKVAAEAEKIEKNLILLGATAIEDKLQEGVPETIAALIKARIKVWVLTGDKRETAINIAHSCNLLSPTTTLYIVGQKSYEEVRDYLLHLKSILNHNKDDEPTDSALVIDGDALKYASVGENRAYFIDMATCCKVVICCRVSPMQKADVVEMVKVSVQAITLAIGDGANDVAMIQAAHVGVGIVGLEGLQAASVSDYAIAQFRFLAKLLFVHGAWSYHRTVKVILYSFYKNICLYIIELWFAIYSAWAGQPVFERWTIAWFNVAFTAFPPFALGLFDRNASVDTMMQHPQLYKLSQKTERAFGLKVFAVWIGQSIFHSIVLYFMSLGILVNDVVWKAGRAGGWLVLGNFIYTYVVVVVCLKAGLEVDTWTWPVHVAIWGSILSWFVFVPVYGSIWPVVNFASEFSGMGTIMYSSGAFWFGLFLVPITTLMADFVYKVIRRTCFKTLADEIRELECKGDQMQLLTRLTSQRVAQFLRSMSNQPTASAVSNDPSGVVTATAVSYVDGSGHLSVTANPSNGHYNNNISNNNTNHNNNIGNNNNNNNTSVQYRQSNDQFTTSMRTHHELGLAAENPSYVPTGSSPSASKNRQQQQQQQQRQPRAPLATISSTNTSVETAERSASVSPTSPSQVDVDRSQQQQQQPYENVVLNQVGADRQQQQLVADGRVRGNGKANGVWRESVI